MTATTAPAATVATAQPALWALLIGNLAIGTGVLLPAGMISDLSADLGVTVRDAGWLILIGGLVIGIGAPVFAMLTSRVDRRLLLVSALLLYAIGHVLSALAPSFTTLMILRAVTIIAAGIFTPQAAATVGLLVPQDQRATGVAFIFLGWSVASVAGIPLASLIAHYAHWRWAFAIMVLLSLLAALLVWRTVPKGLVGTPLSLASWGQVFGSPALLLVLLVTVASSAGQFAMLTYLQPYLQSVFGASALLVALVLTGFGVAGIAGNTIASRVVGTWGPARTVLTLLIIMLAGFLAMAAASLSPAPAASLAALFVLMAGIGIWGVGTFGSNSLQQARLIGMAPPLASASVALNTSAIYIGQAIGPAVGGPLFGTGSASALVIASATLLALAVALSFAADRVQR